MKELIVSFIFFLFSSSSLLACPMCGGTSATEKNQMTAYILIGFIVIMYIPFFIIYRCIKKYAQYQKKATQH